MAFITHKTVSGKRYAQVVESYRDEQGRPRQRVLLHLGTYTPAQAYIYWPLFNGYEEKAQKLTELVDSGKLKISDEEMRQVEEERRRKRALLERLEQPQ